MMLLKVNWHSSHREVVAVRSSQTGNHIPITWDEVDSIQIGETEEGAAIVRFATKSRSTSPHVLFIEEKPCAVMFVSPEVGIPDTIDYFSGNRLGDAKVRTHMTNLVDLASVAWNHLIRTGLAK